MPPKTLKFEEALSRLEEIVRKLEGGALTLEESLKAFEEGVQLSRTCGKLLEEAKGRVEQLVQKESKELEVKPFNA